MSATTELPARAVPSTARPSRLRLGGRPRRMLRAAHIVVSVGWLGLTAAMVTLGLTAALTTDQALARAAYTLMGHIGTRTIAGAAVATLVSAVVLSVLTPWGLLRQWWIVVKIAITLAVIATALGLTNGWVERAAAVAGDGGGAAAWSVVAGSATHLLLLAGATLISVDKPWGPTRRRAPRSAGGVQHRDGDDDLDRRGAGDRNGDPPGLRLPHRR